MTIFGADLFQFGVAFLVAVFVTGLELITAEYPRTSRFILQSIWLYGYIIPRRFKPAVRAALAADIDLESTSEGVIIVYLTSCGIQLTKRNFP